MLIPWTAAQRVKFTCRSTAPSETSAGKFRRNFPASILLHASQRRGARMLEAESLFPWTAAQRGKRLQRKTRSPRVKWQTTRHPTVFRLVPSTGVQNRRGEKQR